jgi:hypothetical protein
MRAAFRVDSKDFIGLVTQKELWKLLAAQTQERNEEAHGGIKGKREREEQLARLELALTELRGLTVGPLRDVRLVKPGHGAYRKGINEYPRAWLVAGPTAPFPKTRLEAFEQLESDELYVVDASDEPVRAGLKLAPLGLPCWLWMGGRVPANASRDRGFLDRVSFLAGRGGVAGEVTGRRGSTLTLDTHNAGPRTHGEPGIGTDCKVQALLGRRLAGRSGPRIA